MVDKNQAVIDFLINCHQIRDNPLFFNFIEAKDNNKQFVTTASERAVSKPFIDGSVLKRYTFNIIDYKSVAYQAIVKHAGYVNENVEDLMDVQSIIDWITEQNESYQLRNIFPNVEYVIPNFGEDCVIDEIKALTENPQLNAVDGTTVPALAKYSISIRIDYIDKSKVLFRR